MKVDRSDPAAVPVPVPDGRAVRAAAAFEALLISRLIEGAGIGGHGPDAALARRVVADALAAGAPFGIGRLLQETLQETVR